jgi:hypothetical protein
MLATYAETKSSALNPVFPIIRPPEALISSASSAFGAASIVSV